jgi:hypothetical protein
LFTRHGPFPLDFSSISRHTAQRATIARKNPGACDMYLDNETVTTEEVHGIYVVPPDEWN